MREEQNVIAASRRQRIHTGVEINGLSMSSPHKIVELDCMHINTAIGTDSVVQIDFHPQMRCYDDEHR